MKSKPLSASLGWGVGLRRRTDSKLKDFIDVGLHYALLEAEEVGVMGCQDLVRL